MRKKVFEQEFVVKNKLGLHVRASARLVALAQQFEAGIFLIRNGEEADCKSILDVMSMACDKGSLVRIRVDGSDAGKAMAAVAALIDNKFDED